MVTDVMSALGRLVDKHLRELSGAEFKVAAYLYRRLERRQQVEMTIAELGLAAGVSTKQAYTVLLNLENSGLLRVASRRGRTSQFSLPASDGATSMRTSPSAGSSVMRQRKPEGPDRSRPLEPPSSTTRSVQAFQPDSQQDKPHETKGPPPVIEPIQSSTTLAPPATGAGSEEEQCRQLASELTGGDAISNLGIAQLKTAIEGQSPKPGALLRRLQELKLRGRVLQNLYQLAYALRELWWL